MTLFDEIDTGKKILRHFEFGAFTAETVLNWRKGVAVQC